MSRPILYSRPASRCPGDPTRVLTRVAVTRCGTQLEPGQRYVPGCAGHDNQQGADYQTITLRPEGSVVTVVRSVASEACS